MATPSNLYAEKIYSEHPLVLWALDDQIDYISLISENQRNIELEWTVINGSASEGSSVKDEPFQNSIVNCIQMDIPSSSEEYTKCVSNDIINFNLLDSKLQTFCIGSYIYIDSPYITSVEIGFEYTDTTTAQTIEHLNTFYNIKSKDWNFVSGTFEKPNDNTNLRIVIKINKTSGSILESDYILYINGTSLGQWSEEFNQKSLGINPISFPSDISLIQDFAVEAQAYGVDSNSGYYLCNQTSLKSRNSSIPMVYGASNTTILSPQDGNLSDLDLRTDKVWQRIKSDGTSDLEWQYWKDEFSWGEISFNIGDKPSLIIPGQGFLNNIGKYREYTVEFWLKANSDSKIAKRIFGPIGSGDGIYLEDGFITLVIGKYFMSHFINEWYRPMLIDLKISNNVAILMINGEEVISLNIDLSQIEFPDQYDRQGKSQDWLGFYSYDDISPLEVDCIAIYSYLVPTIVAKRRFVYGQGVVLPEGLSSSYGGVTAFIDYPFADYTSNYKYPDFAKWEQGSFDNLISNQISLLSPNYGLPQINLGGQDINTWYKDNKDIQSGNYKFISLKPKTSWSSINSYINFNKFNFLTDDIHSIYSIIQINANDLTEQIIFKIYNTLTNNYFIAKKSGNLIKYSLYYNEEEEDLYSTEFDLSEKLSVGINIHDLTNYFGGNVASFFGNRNGLTLYVGGNQSQTQTFSGYIYRIGFSTSYNSSFIEDHFLSNGIALIESGSLLVDHTASYTLEPFEKYGQFFLDISISGYWEDYMPLSYFGQYVKDKSGNSYYDLDFLQFNIGYPAPTKSEELEVVTEWQYIDLQNSYSTPVQKTYAQLDNYVYTGWNNYEDLSQKSEKYYKYNTDDSYVNSYVTFQYIKNGANKIQSDFTETSAITNKKIVDANNYSDWENRKFEVVDNTIIYPPKEVSFTDLALVYRIDFNLREILHKPVSIKNLEISSQALNDNSFNPIGTRFGSQLFPYKKDGFYYDYKSKNPYAIYKGSSPYLYLTKNSGIEVRGDFDPMSNRGISFPINSFSSSEYNISGIQFWGIYNYDTFPATDTSIFEIKYKSDTIKFYIVSDSETGKRGRIFGKSEKTGNIYTNLKYYLNGNIVREPVLSIKEWFAIGIEFLSILDFSSYVGSLNINGPILVNNISYYQANNSQRIQSRVDRSWQKLKQPINTNTDWSYWLNNFTWGGARSISETDLYLVDPSMVYKTYIGTNKIIIDDQDGLVLDSDKIKVYSNISWSTSVETAV